MGLFDASRLRQLKSEKSPTATGNSAELEAELIKRNREIAKVGMERASQEKLPETSRKHIAPSLKLIGVLEHPYIGLAVGLLGQLCGIIC